MPAPPTTAWWARGLLFENCNCQLVCPGHVHFEQLCTHERCTGWWAMRVDAGAFGELPLAGIKAVVAFDSPRHMAAGGWTESILIDAGGDRRQAAAWDTILRGEAGGPWAVLARFVAQRTPTRAAEITLEEPETEFGRGAGVTIAGVLRALVAPIRGRDRNQPVRFENIFNQIHAPSQILARGETAYDDGAVRIHTRGTHALVSNFDWAVLPR